MTPSGVHQATLAPGTLLPPGTVWLDISDPTPQESASIAQLLRIELPTRDETHEIELSSRLYLGNGASYMIADVVASNGQRAETHSVTFILTDRHLVTLRFRELVPFQQFQARALQTPEILVSSEVALIGLLEAIIAHGGVLLRELSSDLERVSQIIFWDPSQEDKRVREGIGLRTAISGIGHAGERSSRIQQSLLSVDRLLVFHGEYAKPTRGSPLSSRIESMSRDTASLLENAEFLSGKAGFLLDATLGFINAEQSQIIKILSVATTIFLPPTLVGTIYGMNFDVMPELSWPYGYPIAIGIMLLSSVLPYIYFKRKGWV